MTNPALRSTFMAGLFLWVGLVAAAIPLSAIAQTATAPTVSKIAFAPATIKSGAVSALTITFNNPNAAAATVVQTLTDTLPAGMTIANPAGLAGTCPAAAQAVPGGRTVSYPAGATLAGTAACTIQVNVTATSTAHNTYYTDSIPAGALVTTLGTSATGASGTVTATGR